MDITGYMIDVQADAETVRVHGKNKAARIALAGEDHESDVVIPRANIAGVRLKNANIAINGNLRITTTAGRTYQLHFRRKQQSDFEALAADLKV